MSFEPHNYLRHILEESDYLLQESAHLTLEQFVASGTLQRAFVRSLEIIGEASEKVPDAYRAQHPEIERRECGTGSSTTISAWNYELVWDVVTTRVPVEYVGAEVDDGVGQTIELAGDHQGGLVVGGKFGTEMAQQRDEEILMESPKGGLSAPCPRSQSGAGPGLVGQRLKIIGRHRFVAGPTPRQFH